MTVKEILKSTASMVGREDVLEYLSGQNTTSNDYVLNSINLMVNLLNLVIGELAGTFIPMIKVQKTPVNNGKIYYKDLIERPMEVRAVYDLEGNKLSFSQTVEYIWVNAFEVNVEYEYAPSNYGLEDQIGYTPKDVSVATLSYGLSAEYSISIGDFDQAVMWHKRYVDSIKEHRKLTNVKTKERCFV
ncbi:MAG: hypothetical protein E7347_06520 [Clostridiales bacterium]|nr:hypothetical protein [Clostridiales bacterium]